MVDKMKHCLSCRSDISILASRAVAVLWLLVAPEVGADPIDRYVDVELKRWHIPGVALAIIHNGHVVKMRGYGLADVERKVPATAGTVFEIGSITKQFTATAIIMLVEQRKVELEDPIGKYLPELPETWNAITIRQLLTHTSGIPDYEEIMGYGGYRNPMTSAQIIALAAGKPLNFATGTKWKYSNTGYYLLTLILEKVSGEPYAQFVHEHIFAPAGMVHTRTSEPFDIIPHRAAGYQYKDGRLENRDPMQPTATGGAGMLVSTIRDLARWDAILDRQSMLSKASYAQMWTDAPLADGKPSGYGFGWFVSPHRNHRAQQHPGGTAGFTANYLRLPDDHLTVIVLGNLSFTGVVWRISNHVASLLVPALKHQYRPIRDEHPAIARIVFDFYSHRTDTDVYVKPLSAEFAEQLKTYWSSSIDYFKVLGLPQSIALVEVRHSGTRDQYRYRIKYKDVSRLVLVTLNEQSQIADLNVEEE